jgi:hypothetical protein
MKHQKKKMTAIGLGLVMGGAAALGAASPASAESITYVPCSAAALSAAISAANTAGGGDLLLEFGCTYTLSTPLAGEDGLPQVTSDISILGAGARITRSATAPAFRIFDVAAEGTLTLSALTLTGGAASTGGGVLNAGTLSLNAVTVSGNSAAGTGGGVENSGDLSVNASRVTANQAVTGGGGVHNAESGSAAVRASSVDHNSVTGTDALGGGILNSAGSVDLALSAVGSNSATGSGSSGAGLATVGGTLHASGATVESNTAAAAPGGIYNENGSVGLTLAAVFNNAPTNCTGSPDPVPGCLN